MIPERAIDEGRRGFSRIDVAMVLHFRDWHIARQYTADALSVVLVVIVVVVAGKMHLGSSEPSLALSLSIRRAVFYGELLRTSANAFRIVHPAVVYLWEVLFSLPLFAIVPAYSAGCRRKPVEM